MLLAIPKCAKFDLLTNSMELIESKEVPSLPISSPAFELLAPYPTNTRVWPIPSSNCLESALLVL